MTTNNTEDLMPRYNALLKHKGLSPSAGWKGTKEALLKRISKLEMEFAEKQPTVVANGAYKSNREAIDKTGHAMPSDSKAPPYEVRHGAKGRKGYIVWCEPSASVVFESDDKAEAITFCQKKNKFKPVDGDEQTLAKQLGRVVDLDAVRKAKELEKPDDEFAKRVAARMIKKDNAVAAVTKPVAAGKEDPDGAVRLNAICQKAGVDARAARMILRKAYAGGGKGLPKPIDDKWLWDKKDVPAIEKLIGGK